MEIQRGSPFKIPDGILLGSATSAFQIEGGDRNNSWYDWCERGRIKDGTSCLRACDHWNRYEEDIALMRRLNQRVYRMGLEWSRIEPENGRFDDEAIAHYRDELSRLLAHGIVPLVTLFHFSLPLWLRDAGGFEREAVVGYFERYVRFVVERLGDIVSEYVTINEPNVYMFNGYFYGTWPPGKRNLALGFSVFRNLALCHLSAYRIIHEVRNERRFQGRTMVGVAHHVSVFEPYSPHPLDRLAARIMDYLFQSAIMRTMHDGRLRFPLGAGAPYGVGRYYDFLGLNYYTRNAARFRGFACEAFPGTQRNDLGWELYPAGLSRLCRRFHAEYGLPIWITENGTCDREDRFRAAFISDHLREVSTLHADGVPVDRYYHWSLLDNFELAEGESAPFGIVRVDFETQERVVRRSGEFYGEICRTREVTDEMIKAFVSS